MLNFFTKNPTSFCIKSKCLWKIVTFSAETQFFVECSSVHVNCTFHNSAWNFQLNMEEVHTEIPKVIRKFEIVGKKSQNWAPELGNSVLSTVNKQGCAWSKCFPLSVPKTYKKLSFSRSCFYSKWSSVRVKCSSVKLVELFQQNPTLFTVKSEYYEKKMLHNSAEKQSFLKFSPVHVKCTFDNSAWNFQLNMETIRTRIPKEKRNFIIVGKKSQNSALELKNAVLSTVQKQGRQ